MSDAVQPVDECHPGTDHALLQRYAESQEPAAFAELSRRYAGMVYATCLRITGNAHDAEELTQDCFFELARRASTICLSVGGWLHRLATHRALNAVRSRTRRRKHEQDAANEVRAESAAEVSWHDVEPLVDRAIEDLPEELRTPVLLHYLENRSQSEVASQLGLHQSTVSRRIQEGLRRLRARLRDSGVVMAVAPLAGLLAANMGHPAGQQLLASLGKIAIAGVGSAATGKAVGGLGASSIKLATWGKIVGTAALPVLAQFVAGGWFGVLAAVALWLHIAWRRPSWFREIQLAFGGEYGYGPFFPFERWTWTTPPADWRKVLVGSLLAALMLGVTWGTVAFAQGRPSVGWAVLTALYVAIPLTTALRIWIRVRASSGRATPDETDSAKPPPDTITVVQYVGFSAVATLSVASLALLCLRTEPMRASYPVYLIVVSIGALWAYVDTIAKTRTYRRCRRARDPSHPEIVPDGESGRRWGLLAVLVFYLAFAGFSPLAALMAQLTNGRSGANSEAAPALLAPLALLFLVGTIRLLSRLRGKVHKLVWCALTAIAVLCAAGNLGLSIAWLLPGRHTQARSVAAPPSPETGLLSVPVLLPSGRCETSGELVYEPGLRIQIQCSQPLRWRLSRNGTVVLETEGALLDVPVTEPGEYRLEAWGKVRGEDRLVLLSKPLHIRPASGG